MALNSRPLINEWINEWIKKVGIELLGQLKMTKYTGPTQNRFFNNQFQLIKNYQTSVCIRSHWKQKCYTPKDPARIVVTLVNFRVVMVREWDVPQRSFLIEKKAGHGCPISAEDEGKGSGLHRCWWRSVWGKKSVNCNVYPSANVLQIVIRNE